MDGLVVFLLNGEVSIPIPALTKLYHIQPNGSTRVHLTSAL